MASSSPGRILGPQYTLKPEGRHDIMSLIISYVIFSYDSMCNPEVRLTPSNPIANHSVLSIGSRRPSHSSQRLTDLCGQILHWERLMEVR